MIQVFTNSEIETINNQLEYYNRLGYEIISVQTVFGKHSIFYTIVYKMD